MPGLIDSIQIDSALVQGGASVTFSVGYDSDGPYRVTDFSWTPRIVGESTGKLQGSGSWPSWRDVRQLELQMEGTIVGSTPSVYWAARMALAEALIPPPSYDRFYKRHGTMVMTLPEVGTVYAYINLVDCSMPLSHSGGTSSRMQFTWHVDDGYWRLQDDGSRVVI